MRIIVSILIIAICLYGLGLGVFSLFFYQQEYGEINSHFIAYNMEEYVTMPYETMEGFMIAMVSVGIAVITSIVLLKTTDLIYPLEIYRLKLVSKNIQLVAGHTSGLSTWHIFEFEDEDGTPITIVGTEKMYCFILPGNIVDVSLKNMRFVDFELFQVSEDQGWG